MQKLVKKVNSLSSQYKEYTDDELKNEILSFKGNKESEELLVKTFAIVREASERVLGLRHYDVQILGGLFINRGFIAEMQTGEGKTLVATLPAVYNALLGRKVHIVTSNEYLATRDSQQMGQLYNFLGLSCGVIVGNMDENERRNNYQKNIVYSTNSELGFDYLRDNMLPENHEPVQQSLDFVIVDEVDSILIDEARTPLIISTQAEDNSLMYIQLANLVRKFQENIDFTRDKENKKLIVATETGVKKIEKFLGLETIYSIENSTLLNAFNQTLTAFFSYERDKDYVVKDNELLIVDGFTGRIMDGRRFADGLHQALEAKENVPLKRESKTIATITLQNYFRLYSKIAGMTGTAKTEENEFWAIYNMPVVQIPKNKPQRRIDLPDVIFRTKKAKYSAVINKIKECNAKGQPILVGTTSIADSEYISYLLHKENIKHTVLNAKHDKEEAEIISHAGEVGAITIATNMAGRGTDIVPDPEVDNLGGLFILGTEKHESRRIDNQLRGRTARQGNHGTTQFYLSLSDDLFKYFGGEKLLQTFAKFQIDLDDTPIDIPLITRTINKCQKKVEAKNFDIRKHLLEYDDVLNQQRFVIYKQRKDIKDFDYNTLKEKFITMADNYIKEKFLDVYANPKKYSEEWELDELVTSVNNFFNLEDILLLEDIENLSKEEIDEYAFDNFHKLLQFKEKIIGEPTMHSIMRTVLLQIVDNYWSDQINNMTILREGIGLQAYGQLNPLVEYKRKAFDMFEEMNHTIQEEFVKFVYSFTVNYSHLP